MTNGSLQNPDTFRNGREVIARLGGGEPVLVTFYTGPAVAVNNTSLKLFLILVQYNGLGLISLNCSIM